MVSLLYGQNAPVAQWAADRIDHVSSHRGFGPSSAIGVISDTGRLIAGVVYHDWQPEARSIQISMAADSPIWARREVIRDLLAYPFLQLECLRVWTAIPLDNWKAIRINEHIGLKREATLAWGFGRKRHAAIFRMLRPDFDRLYGES